MASNIGNGRGVLEVEDQIRVLGVGLIADGRRVVNQQINVGPNRPAWVLRSRLAASTTWCRESP